MIRRLILSVTIINRITTITVVCFYLSDDNLAVDGCKRRMWILLDVLNVPLFTTEIFETIFFFPSCCASHIRVFMQLKMRLEAFVHYLPPPPPLFTYKVTSIALWFSHSFVLISFTESADDSPPFLMNWFLPFEYIIYSSYGFNNTIY